MIKARVQQEPIEPQVKKIDTWTPRNAAPHFEFEYIDIASVDRAAKAIIGTSKIVAAEAPSRARQIVKANDVLVSTVRPNLNAVAFVPEHLSDAIASTGFCVLRCHPQKLDHRYLYYWVRTPQFVSHLTRQATGASYPAVTDRIVKQSKIPLPPLSEQKRIAAILDQADTIRRKRQQVLQDATILPRVVFREMFGDATKNDYGWPVSCVDEVGEVQLGRQRSPKYQTGKYAHRYLRVANVYEDRFALSDVLEMDFNDRDFERYQLRDGDILLNEGQSTELVGRPAIWRSELEHCCFQNTLVRFRANTSQIDEEYALGVFLDFLRRGAFARTSSKTSSVAHLGAGRFAAMEFPVPPKKLQKEYGDFRRESRKVIAKYTVACNESNDLFNSLVQRAFKGEL